MRILKLALLSGIVLAVTTLGPRMPASASSLIANLSKGLSGATGPSVLFVQRRRRRRGSRRRSRGRNGAAAAAVGAAAIIGLIGAAAESAAARADACEDRHGNVDRQRLTWYDRRGREHLCE